MVSAVIGMALAVNIVLSFVSVKHPVTVAVIALGEVVVIVAAAIVEAL